MQDILTSSEVRASLREHAGLIREWRREGTLEVMVRDSVNRPDYASIVLAQQRRREVSKVDRAEVESPLEELIPAWERALGTVLYVQDSLRWLLGTVIDGEAAPAPKPERDLHAEYLEDLRREDLGYVHDPGWTNGSLGSHGAQLVPDDERALQGLPPGPNVRGFAAFALLWEVTGIPELAWHFSASALEIGYTSTFGALVGKLLLGTAMGGSTGDAPDGPSLEQIAAATMQRMVRQGLGDLPTDLQAVLDLAYTDRRYETSLVATYGIGLAPLVWRAATRAGEAKEIRGEVHVTPGKGALRDLLDDVRRHVPGFAAKATQNRKLEERIKAAAGELLAVAHAGYCSAVGILPPPRKKRRLRPQLTGEGVRDLAGAPPTGNRGTKRRRWREAPRRAA